MAESEMLLRCDEAQQFVEQIQDPVTKNLFNMAYVRFVKAHFFDKTLFPSSDIDMLYVVSVLNDFFTEHDVLARTLAGEKVGVWFDQEP